MRIRLPRRRVYTIALLSALGLTVGLGVSAPAPGPWDPVTGQAGCGEAAARGGESWAGRVLRWSLASVMVASQRQPLPEVRDPTRLHIVIDRYTQTLTLYEGEREVARYPVAVGKPETPSPPGEWRITNKSRDWGGGFGTRWLGLNVPWGIYGIHGTNKPWSIGTQASAGCIRMFNQNVEQLYEIVPVGTPVVIKGDLPQVAARAEIAEGMSGKVVLVLQFRLRQAGFDFGKMDGRFGPAVAAAVRDFQALYGFPADGVLTRDQQRVLWFPE